MAIDGAADLYVTTNPGVQVFSPEGKFLGLIPTPRNSISVAFSGPGKKTLYVACLGALGPDGQGDRHPARYPEHRDDGDLQNSDGGGRIHRPREVTGEGV